MSPTLELLYDISGINEAGDECHPFKALIGAKRGFFSYTFQSDNTTFAPIGEEELRYLVEVGECDQRVASRCSRPKLAGPERDMLAHRERARVQTAIERGRIRMVPVGAVHTSGAGALRVVSYKGHLLPL